jgi:hypothetical protein
MQRQALVAVLLALLTALAGCGGEPGGVQATGVPPTGPSQGQVTTIDDVIRGEFATTAHSHAFGIPDFGVHNGSDGQLVVEVTVRNNAPRTHEARLTVLAPGPNGTVRGSTVVAVDTNQTATRNVSMPVAYDEWGGSLDFTWTPPNQTATTPPAQ